MARLSRTQTKPYSGVLLRLAIIVVQVKHIRNIRLSALELDWQPVSCFLAFRVMRSAYLACPFGRVWSGLWTSRGPLKRSHMKCVNRALARLVALICKIWAGGLAMWPSQHSSVSMHSHDVVDSTNRSRKVVCDKGWSWDCVRLMCFVRVYIVCLAWALHATYCSCCMWHRSL